MRPKVTDRELRDRQYYGSKGPKESSMAHERRMRKAAELRAKREQERKEAIIKSAKAIKVKQAKSLMSALESL